MTLNYNLLVGWGAIRHVRKNNIRANNTSAADRLSEEEWNRLTHCIDSVRGQFLRFCEGVEPTECQQWKMDATTKLAELTNEKGCGNCHEQAAVAIQYLRGLGVRPLDVMNLMPHHGIDHVFIVIGRLDNQTDPQWVELPQSRAGGSIDEDPATWGPDAVVCDPWRDQAYPATEIQTKMYREVKAVVNGVLVKGEVKGVLRPVSIWRIN